MSLLPVAGMTIAIGKTMSDSASDFVASDFTSLNASPDAWINIDGWETMGAVGDSVADIAETLINRGRTNHQKGTAEPPAMGNTFAIVPGDAGQTALIAAGLPSNKSNYTFRITGNETGGTSPSYIYFLGLVMGTPEQGGGANTIRKLGANIQINSNVVRVAAV
jgi:hypothetical protein